MCLIQLCQLVVLSVLNLNCSPVNVIYCEFINVALSTDFSNCFVSFLQCMCVDACD